MTSLLVTYPLADLECLLRGKPFFFFFFLALELSAVLGLTFVYIVMKHSTVLCEV